MFSCMNLVVEIKIMFLALNFTGGEKKYRNVLMG